MAFDGSPASHNAHAVAVALAAQTGASVDLLGVAPASGPTPTDLLNVLRKADERAATLEREAHTSRLIDDSDVPTTSHVLRGNPGHVLVAATADLDLIACGSRGRGRIQRALLGSTSTTLIRNAFCPVLLVPPGLRPQAADASQPRSRGARV